MLKINLPSNVMTFFSALVPTIGFDIMELIIDWSDQRVLLFDNARHDLMTSDITGQTSKIGYEYHNTIMILNTVAFVILYIVAKIVVYIFTQMLIWMIIKCFGDKTYGNLKEGG